MGDDLIRVLIVEDNPDDALLIQSLLNSADDGYLGSFESIVATSIKGALDILENNCIDAVLLDLGLPDTREFYGIKTLAKNFPSLPIVVLTKQREETIMAVEALKCGAQDYFFKGHLHHKSALERAILYSIERKKTEAELRLAKEEADLASRAKSAFLSNMSHDIRTPLNCIVGMADLLVHSQLSEENTNYVQMMNKASDNLLSLVNNILDISKIESGQFQLSGAPFDLLEVIENALDIISPRADGKKLELLFSMDPETPRYVIGDSERIKQVLINLLGNAIKYTNVGEVSLEVRTKGQIQNNKITIQIAIKDTGIGIPKDKIPFIFESFTQLENKTSSKREGSGLGLTICKNLLDLMRGAIDVQSEVGQGSVFTIDLPLLCLENLPTASVPLIDLKGKTFLVVDDNGANQVIISSLLQTWGAMSRSAHTAEKAMTLVNALSKKQNFDYFIVDLRMPGIATGGLELSRKLMEKGISPESIIILLPPSHRHGDIDQIKRAGIGHYLTKPLKPIELASIFTQNLSISPKKPPEKVSLRELKVLVVDDSDENRELITAYCKNTSFKIDTAENGKVALEKYKNGSFDLILMDLQMPFMDGYQALLGIRQWEDKEKKKKTPVIALTAFALKEEAEKCLNAGFDAHVTKPIRRNHLLNIVNKYAA